MFNAGWQRCRVHFMRNALAYAGKSGRRIVSAFIATAFAQDDADAATGQWRKVADQFRPKLPKLAAFLDEAETDVLCPNALPNQSAPTTVEVAVETPNTVGPVVVLPAGDPGT